MKPLSGQLADLSARAKNAEEAMTAAQKEAHDKLVGRKEQAHAAATNAVAKVNQEMKSIGDSASQRWTAVKLKIAADVDALKTRVATQKHEHDVKRAGKHADRLEQEASFAVDYAIASVEQAKLSVLDAVDARLSAEELRAA